MLDKMKSKIQTWLLVIFFCYSSTSLTHLCFAGDTISSGQSLTLNQTLISKAGKFELGYFRPGTSLNYYIGIWFTKVYVQNKTVVWVANRETPLTDNPTSSELKLLENGNLVLLNQLKKVIWSARSMPNANVSSEAMLGDDGNLVLRTGSAVVWQSFDYPTDTLLPGAKIGYDNISNKLLTSWKNSNDPARGLYSLHLDRYEDTLYILSNQTRYLSGRAWNGKIFDYNFRYVKNGNESYYTYDIYGSSSISSRIVMDLSGQVKILSWDENTQIWFLHWSRPKTQCEVYNYCGAFGVCNQGGLPFCRCFDGFLPRSPNDWNNLNDFSGGRVRKIHLQCGDEVGFLQDSQQYGVIYQQLNDTYKTAEDCKRSCLDDCSCNAYAFKSSCLLWKTDVLALQPLMNDEVSYSLHLKVAASEITSGKKQLKAYIIVLIAGSIFISILCCVLCAFKMKEIGKLVRNETTETSLEDLSEELPFFDFNTVAAATNNFSNKLGQGGFGPVYKGKLLDEREIAVKRLSRSSGQGAQEFKNELMLISKLQHKNLVRFLGYCIAREEKILLYEYMPNKSLDAFLFDPTKRILLDWSKRFSIIDGIARGLLYLHRDSRLKVIHRDLKASNILLDEDMNPKISDFGMAIIFCGKQIMANTNRVVGTYGYMSPEYAMKGIFSEKSDVFSFGVLLLEIVSTMKNTDYYLLEESYNLLGYVWGKWNENKVLEIMDPTLAESYNSQELMRCIHIGLLCVQDHAIDRPTMSVVVSMLGSEGTLPLPKQPAFTIERTQFSNILFNINDAVSINTVTITNLEGR